MNSVQWGIIGCGDVTEHKSGPAFNKVQGSGLVAVMRRDADKAADYARRHQVPRWYDDADALIHDAEVNAIYVATPPNTHAEYAIRAMEAGKPVYVEKPMALNADECQRMVNVARKTGQPLFVAYYRRQMPYFLKVKELIDQGAIGAPRLVDMRLWWPAKAEELAGSPGWRTDPTVSGGGHFHDLAAHQFDLLDYLLGTVDMAVGHSGNLAGLYEAPDTFSASFAFASGVLGSGTWHFAASADRQEEQTIIVGSEGTLQFSFFGPTEMVLENDNGRQTISINHPEHVQQPLIATVVASLLHGTACPSTGESAMRTSAVLDRITGR